MSDKPNNIPDNMMLIPELFEHKIYFDNGQRIWQPVIRIVTTHYDVSPELLNYAKQQVFETFGRKLERSHTVSTQIYNSNRTTSILIKYP